MIELKSREEYLSEMNRIHNMIKDSPFRKDPDIYESYEKGYYDNLFRLAELFYSLGRGHSEMAPELKDKQSIVTWFTHDMNAAITAYRNARYHIKTKSFLYKMYNVDGERITAEEYYSRRIIIYEQKVETFIQSIHNYLRDDEFISCFLDYHHTFAEWVYDPEKKDFFMTDRILFKEE